MHRFAVLSDTHGLLRPEAEKALDGCEGIFHAGDVGRPEILERLGRHMPVIAVRGNVDTEGFEHLSTKYEGTFAGLRVFMTHRPSDLPADLTGYDLVICGHTHRYSEEMIDGRLWLNPGSCGRARFGGQRDLFEFRLCGRLFLRFGLSSGSVGALPRRGFYFFERR